MDASSPSLAGLGPDGNSRHGKATATREWHTVCYVCYNSYQHKKETLMQPRHPPASPPPIITLDEGSP
ncbi:MAG TPA: hypothetical protein VF807_05380, partial [Ktedonobacterales bacterium]